MNAGHVAALVAAGAFALLAGAGVYLVVKLARLVTAAIAVVDDYRRGADELLGRANAAISRADEQLARTEAVADGAEQLTARMSELSEQVAAATGMVRLLAHGLSATGFRIAAAGYGVRRALAARRSGQVLVAERGKHNGTRR
jgi:methyl-accepting chemotaxis protein